MEKMKEMDQKKAMEMKAETKKRGDKEEGRE